MFTIYYGLNECSFTSQHSHAANIVFHLVSNMLYWVESWDLEITGINKTQWNVPSVIQRIVTCMRVKKSRSKVAAWKDILPTCQQNLLFIFLHRTNCLRRITDRRYEVFYNVIKLFKVISNTTQKALLSGGNKLSKNLGIFYFILFFKFCCVVVYLTLCEWQKNMPSLEGQNSCFVHFKDTDKQTTIKYMTFLCFS